MYKKYWENLLLGISAWEERTFHLSQVPFKGAEGALGRVIQSPINLTQE